MADEDLRRDPSPAKLLAQAKRAELRASELEHREYARDVHAVIVALNRQVDVISR
jgi:hypothetical protein